MTKFFFRLANVLLASLMLVGCDCCDDESVDFNFAYTCSEDLLKQVTPVITYTDENGSMQTIELTEASMKQSSTTTFEYNGGKVSISGAGDYIWQKSMHFDEFGVSREMTVTYKARPDAENIADILYINHGLICNIFAESDDVNITDIETNITVGVSLGGTAVQEYIQELLNSKDYRKVAVDKGGKATREK